MNCAKHGEQRVTPDDNGRVYCPRCIAEGSELHPFTLDELERVEREISRPLGISMGSRPKESAK